MFVEKTFEDSMQELNYLIDELDLFQREIDESKQKKGEEEEEQKVEKIRSEELIHNMKHNSDSNLPRGVSGNNIQYNSDSELNRHASEHASDGGNNGEGYENLTFAHFAAVASTPSSRQVTRAISTSLTDVVQTPQQDTASESGSGVVVIYDHQIPMTPDIDYVKQNSEIVLLRTKDPQLQSTLPQQHMRELQQLPEKLCELGVDSGSDTSPTKITPITATIAPAKQRLSSFRASSEQQLQLLGISSTNNTHRQKGMKQQQQQQLQQTQQHGSASLQNNHKLVELASNDTLLLRHKLPPKPASLSIYSGGGENNNVNNNNNNNMHSSNNSNSNMANFKADLAGKIRKQEEKLLLQQQQLQQEQQQSQPTTSKADTNNICNNDTKTTTIKYSHHNNHIKQQQQQHASVDLNTRNFVSLNDINHISVQKNGLPATIIHNNHNHLYQRQIAVSSSTTSSSSPSQSTNSLPFTPSSIIHTNNINKSILVKSPIPIITTSLASPSLSSSSLSTTSTTESPCPYYVYARSNVSVAASVVSTATTNSNNASSKPNISPRPASLAGSFQLFFCFFHKII